MPAGDLAIFARLFPAARRPTGPGALPPPGEGVALLSHAEATTARLRGSPPRLWAVGSRLSPDLGTEQALAGLGYRRAQGPPMAPGEFGLRGDRLALWPLGASRPAYLDLFGDTLEAAPCDPFPVPVAAAEGVAALEDWLAVGRWLVWRAGEEEEAPHLPQGLTATEAASRPRPGDPLRVTRPGTDPLAPEDEAKWAEWLEGQGLLPIRCGPGREWPLPLAAPEHWEGPGVWLLPPPGQERQRSRLFTLADLEPGDLVVHRDHGLARYTGLVTSSVGNQPREFLRLEFAEEDEVLVPVSGLLRLQRYVGDGAGVKPNALGSSRWRRRVAKAREGSVAFARELHDLYRRRSEESGEGRAWPPDPALEAKFAAGFPHKLTSDQVATLRAVHRDQEVPAPMDRILAGDVGYGKTEVALRAAFRVALHGGQAAILAPTTVLARQHAERAAARFAPFGIPVHALSRLTPDTDRKAAKAALAAGKEGVVVGTHELLGKGVSLPNLALLVIDEEQRFGVRHKERLPLASPGVDLLILSATPIPRTLFSSIVGLRDASSLAVPPAGRLPVATFVERWSNARVGEVVAAELARGGKAFFLHNRVRTQSRRAAWLRDRFDSVVVVNGQLGAATLESRLLEFLDTPQAILLTTSIVQNGVDIAGVDTIVVEDAHRFGLGELHQLRGRIGRRGKEGVALFCLPPDGTLTDTAARRLDLIASHAELGAGFRLARADLELRGAGEILGTSQSGHLSAVGLELFSELLEDAVSSVRGRPSRARPLDWQVPVPGALPSSIPESERLALYARIFEGGDPEAGREVYSALRGDLPEQARELLRAALLHRTAAALPIASARWRQGRLEVVPAGALKGPLPPSWEHDGDLLVHQAPLDSRLLLAGLEGLAPALPPPETEV